MFLKADSLLFFVYVKEKEKVASPDSAPWAQTLNKIHFGKIPYSQNWTRSRKKNQLMIFQHFFLGQKNHLGRSYNPVFNIKVMI